MSADGTSRLYGMSEEQEIASDQLDDLRENPDRCAQVNQHAGRHPWVRFNPEAEAYEIVDQGHSKLDVETCEKDSLLNLFAENPVDIRPLAAATYSPDEPGTASVWEAVDERADDVIYTDRVGGDE